MGDRAAAKAWNTGTPKDKGETYVVRGGRTVASMRWRPDLDRWVAVWSHGGWSVWCAVPAGFRWCALVDIEWA